MTHAAFKTARETVGKFSLLILPVGIVAGIARTQADWEFRIPLLILAMPVAVVVHGWITGTLHPLVAGSFMAVLKENWARYFGVVIALNLLFFVLSLPVRMLIPYTAWMVVVLTLLRAAYNLATVYVLPLVFLKRMHLPAIPAGVAFLRGRFRSSGWLAAGIVLNDLLLMASMFAYRDDLWGQGFVLAVLMVAAAVFIDFLVFAGAVLGLVEGPEPAGRIPAEP